MGFFIHFSPFNPLFIGFILTSTGFGLRILTVIFGKWFSNETTHGLKDLTTTFYKEVIGGGGYLRGTGLHTGTGPGTRRGSGAERAHCSGGDRSWSARSI